MKTVSSSGTVTEAPSVRESDGRHGSARDSRKSHRLGKRNDGDSTFRDAVFMSTLFGTGC